MSHIKEYPKHIGTSLSKGHNITAMDAGHEAELRAQFGADLVEPGEGPEHDPHAPKPSKFYVDPLKAMGDKGVPSGTYGVQPGTSAVTDPAALERLKAAKDEITPKGRKGAKEEIPTLKNGNP